MADLWFALTIVCLIIGLLGVALWVFERPCQHTRTARFPAPGAPVTYCLDCEHSWKDTQ